MTKTIVNLCIDLIAAISLLVMVATGYILRYVLLENTHKTHMLWGMSRGQWGDIHFWASLGLLAILCTHLVMHWRWVVGTLGHRIAANPRWKTHAGWVVIAIVTIGLIGFGWAAHLSVQPIPTPNDSATVPGVPAIDYWKDIYPVFERSCLRCHGPERASAGFRIDRRESLIGPDPTDRWVSPGDVAHSPLLVVITGTRPGVPYPEFHRLSEAERDLIHRWIEAGAQLPDRPR